MKKLLFFAAAMLVLALPAANAQKVNTVKEVAKLEKADATLQDVKKNTKAATWNAHGKAYTDAYMLPTKDLMRNIPIHTLMNAGAPIGQEEGVFAGTPVIVVKYEYVDVYVDQNMFILGWKQLMSVKEGLAETAIASYKKAYELDPKLGEKINVNATTLANALIQQGEMLNFNGNVHEAAYNFELAYEALTIAPQGNVDSASLFNAAMLYAIDASSKTGDEALAAFRKTEELCNKYINAGYKDETGNIYYYLFHSYYAQKDVDRDLYLGKAKEALLTGIKLYPKNNLILDGLMQLYTAEEGVGDPAELVTMIDASLKEDPTNYDLWFGRGRVFNALKNYDECIKSFEKCVELRPGEFEPLFYTGYFIIEKANAQIEALNSNTNMDYEQYEAENAKINLIYAEAIPWLEKAYETNPADGATIEYLNQLCFRLRDMDGMMDKYNKYHELYLQTR